MTPKPAMNLDALARLCEQATAGPWVTYKPRVYTSVRTLDGTYICEGRINRPTAQDADFIASAREAMPTLIEELRTLRAERPKLLAVVKAAQALPAHKMTPEVSDALAALGDAR